MCFAWAVLSALHPATYAQRVTNYRRYLNSIDLTGMKVPSPICQVGRFEKNNPTLSINVYVLGKARKGNHTKVRDQMWEKTKTYRSVALNVRREVALCLDKEYECSDLSQIKE
jgi:hypothetical protein